MIGKKIDKKDFLKKEYMEALSWCAKNKCMLKKVDDGFEICKRPTPKVDIEKLKKVKLNKVDTWTAKKITSGMVSSCVGYPVLYDTDRDTQDKLALALGLANAGVLQVRYPEGFPCRGYKQIEAGVYEEEKTVHLMNASAVIEWNTEFGEHLKKCTAEGWAKQAEVSACTTKEELDAIVLE